MDTLELVRSLGLTTRELEKLVERNRNRATDPDLSATARDTALKVFAALDWELQTRLGKI